MREGTKTVYVANDGTRFFTKYECEKHEEKVKSIEERFESLSKITQYNAGDQYELCPFSYDDTLYCIPITSKNVVEIIKEWSSLFDQNYTTDDLISESDIGKRIFFSEYDGYLYRFGTPYELKRLFCDKVDELANIKCEVEGENE